MRWPRASFMATPLGKSGGVQPVLPGERPQFPGSVPPDAQARSNFKKFKPVRVKLKESW